MRSEDGASFLILRIHQDCTLFKFDKHANRPEVDIHLQPQTVFASQSHTSAILPKLKASLITKPTPRANDVSTGDRVEILSANFHQSI